jgi:hypothetical protein
VQDVSVLLEPGALPQQDTEVLHYAGCVPLTESGRAGCKGAHGEAPLPKYRNTSWLSVQAPR